MKNCKSFQSDPLYRMLELLDILERKLTDLSHLVESLEKAGYMVQARKIRDAMNHQSRNRPLGAMGQQDIRSLLRAPASLLKALNRIELASMRLPHSLSRAPARIPAKLSLSMPNYSPWVCTSLFGKVGNSSWEYTGEEWIRFRTYEVTGKNLDEARVDASEVIPPPEPSTSKHSSQTELPAAQLRPLDPNQCVGKAPSWWASFIRFKNERSWWVQRSEGIHWEREDPILDLQRQRKELGQSSGCYPFQFTAETILFLPFHHWFRDTFRNPEISWNPLYQILVHLLHLQPESGIGKETLQDLCITHQEPSISVVVGTDWMWINGFGNRRNVSILQT